MVSIEYLLLVLSVGITFGALFALGIKAISGSFTIQHLLMTLPIG